MYVFDMIVYVGMCPNSCMMNDVLCIVACECYCLSQCGDVVYYYRAGCITLGQTNKSSAGCVSLKVLEHDEEHNEVH